MLLEVSYNGITPKLGGFVSLSLKIRLLSVEDVVIGHVGEII